MQLAHVGLTTHPRPSAAPDDRVIHHNGPIYRNQWQPGNLFSRRQVQQRFNSGRGRDLEHQCDWCHDCIWRSAHRRSGYGSDPDYHHRQLFVSNGIASCDNPACDSGSDCLCWKQWRVSPNTLQTVNFGGSVTFTANPAIGFAPDQWLVNNSVAQIGGMVLTLHNVSVMTTVMVTFKPVSTCLTGSSITNGLFKFTAAGTPESQFILQISPNLTAWSPFSTNTIGSDGTCTISVPIQQNLSQVCVFPSSTIVAWLALYLILLGERRASRQRHALYSLIHVFVL